MSRVPCSNSTLLEDSFGICAGRNSTRIWVNRVDARPTFALAEFIRMARRVRRRSSRRPLIRPCLGLGPRDCGPFQSRGEPLSKRFIRRGSARKVVDLSRAKASARSIRPIAAASAKTRRVAGGSNADRWVKDGQKILGTDEDQIVQRIRIRDYGHSYGRSRMLRVASPSRLKWSTV